MVAYIYPILLITNDRDSFATVVLLTYYVHIWSFHFEWQYIRIRYVYICMVCVSEWLWLTLKFPGHEYL